MRGEPWDEPEIGPHIVRWASHLTRPQASRDCEGQRPVGGYARRGQEGTEAISRPVARHAARPDGYGGDQPLGLDAMPS
jgi:hypothetical protein